MFINFCQRESARPRRAPGGGGGGGGGSDHFWIFIFSYAISTNKRKTNMKEGKRGWIGDIWHVLPKFQVEIKFLQILPTSQVKIVIFSEYWLYVFNFGAFSKFSQDFRSKINIFSNCSNFSGEYYEFSWWLVRYKIQRAIGPAVSLGLWRTPVCCFNWGYRTINLPKLQPYYSGPLGPLSPLGYEGHLYAALIGVLNYKFTQITAVIQRAIGPAVSIGP